MNRADFEPALRRAGLIDGPLPPAPPDGGPWYLQAVSGFGAWLAALLVLSMLGGLVGDLWSSTGARMLIGGALCAGAAVVARRAQAKAAGAREGAFLAQFMLACALAGIALLGSVVVEHVHGSVRQAGALALLAAVLLAANPERVHRALMAWMRSQVSRSKVLVVFRSPYFFMPPGTQAWAGGVCARAAGALASIAATSAQVAAAPWRWREAAP